MAKKSEDRVSMNAAIHEKFSSMPDPLHFELPHTHKKLLEAIYILVVVGALISVLVLNIVGILTVKEANASIIVIMILAVILMIMIIEKAMIAHKPEKSSS